MPNFSEGVLFFLSSFLVPLILYSNCEYKGNVSSIFKCLEHAYSEGERMKEPTFTLSLCGLPKPYSSFSRDVTTNYAMARAPDIGHAGGHSAGRVVSKQRPFIGQLLRGLFIKVFVF